jgi:hypothetical protein
MNWKTGYLVVLSMVVLVHSSAVQAITLFKSNTLELYSRPAENRAVNDHPVLSVDVESLTRLLASLQVRSEEADSTVHLMEEGAAINAAQELAHALRRVNHKQDIHMVSYRNLGGLLNTRRLATGMRVFFRDDNLNLIFGQVDEFQDEFSNRRRNGKSARPGSRDTAKLSGGNPQAANWFQFKDGRTDWVIYPVAQTIQTTAPIRLGKEAAVSPQTAAQEEPTQSATATEQSSQVNTTAAVESSQSRAVPSPSSQATSAPTAATISDKIAENRWQDLEEGLETLERLRKKQLISEEEFQSKRKVLLDSIEP